MHTHGLWYLFLREQIGKFTVERCERCDACVKIEMLPFLWSPIGFVFVTFWGCFFCFLVTYVPTPTPAIMVRHDREQYR